MIIAFIVYRLFLYTKKRFVVPVNAAGNFINHNGIPLTEKNTPWN